MLSTLSHSDREPEEYEEKLEEKVKAILKRPLNYSEKGSLETERKRIIFTPQTSQTDREDVVEPDHAFQARGNRTKLYISDVGVLKPGDHLAWHRPYLIWHHAIFLEANGTLLRVIHWKKNGKWVIVDEWISINDQQGDWYRIDYETAIIKANPSEVVVYRALNKVSETNYQLLENNCESFASYCKIGEYKSCQKNWFWNNITQTLQTTAARLLEHTLRASSAIVKEVSKVTFVEIGKQAGTITLAESVEKLKRASNTVGAAIVIAVEGAFMIWDISKFYERRRDGRISFKDFVETATQRFCEGMFGAGLAIGGSIAGAAIGGYLGALAGGVVPLVGTVVGAAVGAFVGSVAGGVLGAVSGRALGSLVGYYTGRMVSRIVRRDDRRVYLNDIATGDHLIIYGNFFHQRCHVIVVETHGDQIKLIRNRYTLGVVRDTIYYGKQGGFISKVIYSDQEILSPSLTVIRAESQLGQTFYDLAGNNCADFAYWCKGFSRG